MSLIQITKRQTVFLQILVSFIAIYICFHDVEKKQILNIFSKISIPLLVCSLILKTIGLIFRETRLWLILEKPRPSFEKTMYIGLASGMLHTFLPLRGADVISIGMLKQYCAVDISRASVAVALSSFFEMLVFGFFLITILFFQPFWYEKLGVEIFQRSIFSTTSLLIAGIFIVSAFAFRGKTTSPSSEQTSPLKTFMRDVCLHTHKAVAIKHLLTQIGVSVLEIMLMIVSFVMGLMALSININAPIGVVSIIMALSAISAIALPPSYGAGPAAVITFVLQLFGCSTEESFAYSGVWWILSQLPTICTGIPSYWLLTKSNDYPLEKESG